MKKRFRVGHLARKLSEPSITETNVRMRKMIVDTVGTTTYTDDTVTAHYAGDISMTVKVVVTVMGGPLSPGDSIYVLVVPGGQPVCIGKAV